MPAALVVVERVSRSEEKVEKVQKDQFVQKVTN